MTSSEASLPTWAKGPLSLIYRTFELHSMHDKYTKIATAQMSSQSYIVLTFEHGLS